MAGTDTPNYQESDVVGKKWIRSHHVVIENPLGIPPKLTFGEQEAIQLGDTVVTQYKGQELSVVFDSNNPKHVALYIALNELYVELREARDLAAATPPPPPEP